MEAAKSARSASTSVLMSRSPFRRGAGKRRRSLAVAR
jgi:hypothetical protein